MKNNLTKSNLMNKLKISSKKANAVYMKNRPLIFTTVGIVGFWGAGISAAVETPKFLKEREERMDELGDSYRVWDTMVIGAKHYWKAGAMGIGATASVAYAHHDSNARLATAMSALALSQKDNAELKAAIQETLGKKKIEELESNIAQKRSDENPPKEEMPTKVVAGGKTWIFDTKTKMDFLASPMELKEAATRLNDRMVSGGEMAASIGEFYDEANVPMTIEEKLDPILRDYGFHRGKCLIELKFTHIVRNGIDAFAMSYENDPVINYWQQDEIFK